MTSVFKLAFLSGLLSLCSACGNANWTSIHRINPVHKGGQIELIDAKQRAIIAIPTMLDAASKAGTTSDKAMTAGLRLCAESSPDVFSIHALAAVAAAEAKGGSEGKIDASGRLALSMSENGATIERTQTINLIRESMYRTCERYMNGMMNRADVQVQAARDQRAMVAILAIEQLTGIVKRAPTILTSEARSSMIVGNTKLLAQQEQESDAVTQKQSAFDDAHAKHGKSKLAYDSLHEGKCDLILSTPIAESPEPSATVSEVKTTTETSATLAGDVSKLETTQPADPKLASEQQAAILKTTEEKAQCSGAKALSEISKTELETAKVSLEASKLQLKATRDLLKSLGAEYFSSQTGTKGSGDAGSAQTAKETAAVVAAVTTITAQAFEVKTEMLYVCTSLIGDILIYETLYPAQKGFVDNCFALLGGQAKKALTNLSTLEADEANVEEEPVDETVKDAAKSTTG